MTQFFLAVLVNIFEVEQMICIKSCCKEMPKCNNVLEMLIVALEQSEEEDEELPGWPRISDNYIKSLMVIPTHPIIMQSPKMCFNNQVAIY